KPSAIKSLLILIVYISFPLRDLCFSSQAIKRETSQPLRLLSRCPCLRPQRPCRNPYQRPRHYGRRHRLQMTEPSCIVQEQLELTSSYFLLTFSAVVAYSHQLETAELNACATDQPRFHT